MIEHNGMLLEELFFNPNDPGILAVSIVPNPAIKEEFILFAVPDKYYYTLRPEYTSDSMVIDTSHNLCKKYAKGDLVSYSVPVIQSWRRYTQYKGWGFTDDGNTILSNFPDNGVDLGSCMFGCRHYLKKVGMFHNNFSFQYEFKTYDTKQRRIRGPVMIGNKMILRPPRDMDGVNWGYVWFSNFTVDRLQKAYGINSNSTFLHEVDISKNMIMTKSWVDKTDPKHWTWMAEYAVISDFIWEQIKSGQVRGFSVELVVSRRNSS